MSLTSYEFVKGQSFEGIVTHLCTRRKSVVAEEILVFIIIHSFVNNEVIFPGFKKLLTSCVRHT